MIPKTDAQIELDTTVEQRNEFREKLIAEIGDGKKNQWTIREITGYVLERSESEYLLKIEALDKANTDKESQIVSLQNRIDFQVEANDILYTDQKKELKNVIAGKIALQSEVERLKAEKEDYLKQLRPFASSQEAEKLKGLAKELATHARKRDVENQTLQSKYDWVVSKIKALNIYEGNAVRFKESALTMSGVEVVLFSDIQAIIEQSKGKE